MQNLTINWEPYTDSLSPDTIQWVTGAAQASMQIRIAFNDLDEAYSRPRFKTRLAV